MHQCAPKRDYWVSCAPICAPIAAFVHGTCAVHIAFIPYWHTDTILQVLVLTTDFCHLKFPSFPKHGWRVEYFQKLYHRLKIFFFESDFVLASFLKMAFKHRFKYWRVRNEIHLWTWSIGVLDLQQLTPYRYYSMVKRTHFCRFLLPYLARTLFCVAL